MYSKQAGKNGKHEAITDSSNISAISYLPVQLFGYNYNGHFRFVTESTSIFQTKHFKILPSIHFLTLLSKEPRVDLFGLTLSREDQMLFLELQAEQSKFEAAMKSFRQRQKDADD
jgi:hypothetical protein